MRSFSIIEKLDIANFVDDNTPYVTGDNISSVVKLLEEVSCAIFQWFKDNEMKANTDKCFLALIVNNISRNKYIFGKYYFQLYIRTFQTPFSKSLLVFRHSNEDWESEQILKDFFFNLKQTPLLRLLHEITIYIEVFN